MQAHELRALCRNDPGMTSVVLKLQRYSYEDVSVALEALERNTRIVDLTLFPASISQDLNLDPILSFIETRNILEKLKVE